VSSAYNVVCDSLSIICGRSFIHILKSIGPGQNLEELHTLLTPNVTESIVLLCSLRILAVFCHVSKTQTNLRLFLSPCAVPI
jgi:hypothetical protein